MNENDLPKQSPEEIREIGEAIMRVAKPVTQPEPAQRLVTQRADPKQLRVEHVGKLLEGAYAGASTLKLTKEEIKKLTADFPDETVEIRGHDGIIFISHMSLRERLWEVFGPGQVAEICRERTIRNDSNEIAVDLVLMIRGIFVAEGIGTAKYYPQNPKGSFGDTVESAWSDALRRCAKKFAVGTQVWRPQYVRDWIANNAVQFQGRWYRKDMAPKATSSSERAKTKTYKLKEPPDSDWPDVEPNENT
jgi:hypothetical protein